MFWDYSVPNAMDMKAAHKRPPYTWSASWLLLQIFSLRQLKRYKWVIGIMKNDWLKYWSKQALTLSFLPKDQFEKQGLSWLKGMLSFWKSSYLTIFQII